MACASPTVGYEPMRSRKVTVHVALGASDENPENNVHVTALEVTLGVAASTHVPPNCSTAAMPAGRVSFSTTACIASLPVFVSVNVWVTSCPTATARSESSIVRVMASDGAVTPMTMFSVSDLPKLEPEKVVRSMS